MLRANFFIPLLTISLAMTACGKKVETNIFASRAKEKKQAINVTGSSAPTTEELQKLSADCIAEKGRLAKNGQVCLTKKTVILPSYEALSAGEPKMVIDSEFRSGKFLVAEGSAGSSVDILFGNRPFATIPMRKMAETQDQVGELAFFANSPNYSDVSVTVWSCFERKMTNRVYCSAEYIP